MCEEKAKFIMKTLRMNCKYIIQNTVRIAGLVYSAVTVIFAFVSWDDLGISDLSYRILALLVILAISILAGGAYTLFFQKIRSLWSCGGRSINVRYLDMLKIAFSKKRSGEKIMVIPVNTGFDTIVDSDPEQKDPLVSPKSLHGQWIKQMNRHGVTVEELNRRIKTYLDANYPGKAIIIKKDRGNNFSYPYGTTVVMRHRKVTFLLLAISKFDEHNVAQSNLEEYRNCLKKIIRLCHDNGQGYDLYIPLMGTKLSGLNLSHKGALEMITSALIFYSDKLRGKVNVVIYPGDRDKVTIFDV